jgi:hypothetical protein
VSAERVLERLLSRPPRRASVTFPYDADGVKELAAARSALFAASGDDLAAARARVAELEAAMVTIRFDLEAIGAERVAQILNEHPPSDEKAKGPTWDAWVLAEVCKAITLSDAPDEPLVGLVPEQMARVLGTLSREDRERLNVEALSLDRALSVIEVS